MCFKLLPGRRKVILALPVDGVVVVVVAVAVV